MTVQEERHIAEYLWDGDVKVMGVLRQIKLQYKRYPEIIRWLYRNELRGQRLFDFIYECNGRKAKTLLPAIKQILIRIDSDIFNKDALTIKELR